VVDGRTDIYSLGVTLCELLTLRPAIDGQDRQEILRKIAQEEPAPPRRLNPAVPRDLETVLLKAIAQEPAERYAAASELAGGLRLSLADGPVGAGRATAAERVARWCKRNRAVAGLMALLGLFLVGGTIGSTAAALRFRELAQGERGAKDQASRFAEAAQ